MDVEEAILVRRSVRSYKDKELPSQKIKEILESVRMAPSARNRQEWKFVVARSDEAREKICESTKYKFIGKASAIIAGVSTDPDYVMSCGIPAGIVDLSIALDHLSLKAAEEGLGTCWIGGFDQKTAKKALGVPDDHEIVALMSLGYPKKSLTKKDKDRKELQSIFSNEQFKE